MLTTVAGGWVGYFSNLKSVLYTPTYMHNALVFLCLIIQIWAVRDVERQSDSRRQNVAPQLGEGEN